MIMMQRRARRRPPLVLMLLFLLSLLTVYQIFHFIALSPIPEMTWTVTKSINFTSLRMLSDVSICDQIPPMIRLPPNRITVIFICTDVAAAVITHLLKLLHASNSTSIGKLAIITAGNDHSMPDELPNFNPTVMDAFLRLPQLHGWWSTNSMQPSRLHQLPIGIDVHTRARQATWFGGLQAGISIWTLLDPRQWLEPTRSPYQQEELQLTAMRDALPNEQRALRVYADFHYNANYGRSFNGAPNRRDCVEALQGNALIVWGSGRKTRWHAWNEKLRLSFEISVPGFGMDCHRTWEALSLGIIVITISTPLDELFEGLPVVIVSDLSTDVNEANLIRWRDEHARKFRDPAVMRRLTTSYWWEIISGRSVRFR